MRLGAGQDERRLGKVEPEYLPGGAKGVCGGQRGGACTAACVKDPVAWAQADPGDGRPTRSQNDSAGSSKWSAVAA